MKNFEKYEKEIKNLGTFDFGFDENDDDIWQCHIYRNCLKCKFRIDGEHCEYVRTNWLYQEYKEPPILTDKEKAYLESFLKPFKDKIQCISKYHNSSTKEEYLIFCVVGDDDMTLPNFEQGTMYKGIKSYEDYTLEELGLFEEIEND